MLTLLGIPNCDTVKKARKYLEAKGVPFTFRDVRAQPLSAEEWTELLAGDHDGALINTRSPSFRKTGHTAAAAADRAVALDVLLQQPTAMKRPAVVRDGVLWGVGFSPERFDALT